MSDISSLSPEIIRAFLAYIQSEPHRWNSNNPHANRKVCQTTVFRYYSVLSVFCRWLWQEGTLSTNPCEKVRVTKPKPKKLKAIDPDDIRKLLNALNGRDFNSVRNKTIIRKLSLGLGIKSKNLY